MEVQSVDMTVEMLNVVVCGGGRLEMREKKSGKSPIELRRVVRKSTGKLRHRICDASTRRVKVNRKIAVPYLRRVA
jgi:hypothetical protein